MKTVTLQEYKLYKNYLNFSLNADLRDLSYINQLLMYPRRDFNPRPLPYQESFLPLSYKGNLKWAGLDQSRLPAAQ